MLLVLTFTVFTGSSVSKTAVFVLKCIYGAAATYPRQVENVRYRPPLQSASIGNLNYNLNVNKIRRFAASRLWNELPFDNKKTAALTTFKTS